MALTLIASPVDNTTVLTASIWTTEFNQIYQNALSLISPLTGDLAAGGNKITGLSLGTVSSPSLQLTGDTDTGIYSSGANTVDVAVGGVQGLSVGASSILRAAPEDARTNTIDIMHIFESTTYGVPAAGIGIGIQFNAESADENPCPFGRIDFAASDVGAGTEDTYMDILLRVAGVALETKWRFQSTAATGFQGTLTHAVTADQSWAFPDETGTVQLKVIADAAPATPVANTIYKESIVHGWVQTSGAGAWTIDADLNVSSITDNGVGDFTINWARAFASANYAVIAGLITGSDFHIGETTTTPKTASLVRFTISNGAAGATDPSKGVSVIAIGSQ